MRCSTDLPYAGTTLYTSHTHKFLTFSQLKLKKKTKFTSTPSHCHFYTPRKPEIKSNTLHKSTQPIRIWCSSTIFNMCTIILYRHYHSSLQSLNLIFIKLVENSFRNLHLHNLKSFPTITLYTTLTQTDSHYVRTGWFQGSIPVQPKLFVDIIVHYTRIT